MENQDILMAKRNLEKIINRRYKTPPTINQMKNMPQKKIEKFINEGLAEVCEDLTKYSKVTPKQKKQFLKYADTFRKLGKIYNVKSDESKKEVINMAKKLTNAGKEDREVKKILLKINKLEKQHSQHLVERACFRYKRANLDKRQTEKKIKELEKKLTDAKRRLR